MARAKAPFEISFSLGGISTSDSSYEVVEKDVSEINFDPAALITARTRSTVAVEKLGCRISHPLSAQRRAECAWVQGRTRFVSRGQLFSCLSRASAMSLGARSSDRHGRTQREEFPRFEQFWIARPATGARQLVLYALLDSRRATGAYRFTIRPGEETVTEVQSRLYLREPVAKLALAPLTSMYFFGENQRAPSEDYRPEVHDSDGLAINTGSGEWIWRPLVNPRRLLVTSFALTDPRGFGLMQRDRNFGSYEDLEARYELRPSIWIEPAQSGAPAALNVQIPTPNEANDNIVAYWVPNTVPPRGTPIDFSYRMFWLKNTDRRLPMAGSCKHPRARIRECINWKLVRKQFVSQRQRKTYR